MSYRAHLHGDPLPWLLEDDPANPGVRFFALRDLCRLPPDDPDLRAARRAVMARGPVPAILAAQAREGYWSKPGRGYTPKYQSTVWSLIFLAQLGADGRDPRVDAGCDYALAHSRGAGGGFCATTGPHGVIHCLQGNMIAALLDLGRAEDARLHEALDFLARSITGDGVAPAGDKETARHDYAGGTTGPGFACAANAGLPCGWGAVKALLALAKTPPGLRTPAVEAATAASVEFLLSRDPAAADYPAGYANQPSGSWFRLGFPLGYVADVLQTLEALAAAGRARDLRLARSLEWLLAKQDGAGRWKLEYSYNGKMWADIEKKGRPSKWVTLRALRVLSAALD